MSINLTYYLRKKNLDLKTFLKINRLTSYEDVIGFCKLRSFLPVSEKEFNSVTKKALKNEAKKKPASRKASSSQKKKSTRPRSKRKPNS